MTGECVSEYYFADKIFGGKHRVPELASLGIEELFRVPAKPAFLRVSCRRVAWLATRRDRVPDRPVAFSSNRHHRCKREGRG